MSDGDTNRDDAMDRAERNAKEEDRATLDAALLDAARALEWVTSDDVWARVPPGFSPRERRLMGPIMARASSVIVPTNRFVKSLRGVNNSRFIRVWASLIWTGRPVAPVTKQPPVLDDGW